MRISKYSESVSLSYIDYIAPSIGDTHVRNTFCTGPHMSTLLNVALPGRPATQKRTHALTDFSSQWSSLPFWKWPTCTCAIFACINSMKKQQTLVAHPPKKNTTTFQSLWGLIRLLNFDQINYLTPVWYVYMYNMLFSCIPCRNQTWLAGKFMNFRPIPFSSMLFPFI